MVIKCFSKFAVKWICFCLKHPVDLWWQINYMNRLIWMFFIIFYRILRKPIPQKISKQFSPIASLDNLSKIFIYYTLILIILIYFNSIIYHLSFFISFYISFHSLM